MTNLLDFDSIDAFITEHDGRCVHDWEKVGGPFYNDYPGDQYFNWKCKECKDYRERIRFQPRKIENPIARDLGKLENYITKKDPLIEIKSSIANGTLWIELLRCGISLYEIFVKPHEFSTVEEAHCCALGTAIVHVLKGQK